MTDEQYSLPTATRYIPAGRVPSPQRHDDNHLVGYRLPTKWGAIEMTHHEPYDDDVSEEVVICDECGHEEDRVIDIKTHLREHVEMNDG